MSKLFEISPTFPPNFHLSADIQTIDNKEKMRIYKSFFEKKERSILRERRVFEKRKREKHREKERKTAATKKQ